MFYQFQKRRNRLSLFLWIIFILSSGTLIYIYHLTPQEEAALRFLTAYKKGDEEGAKRYTFSGDKNIISDIFRYLRPFHNEKIPYAYQGSIAPLDYQYVTCETISDTTSLCKVCCGTDNSVNAIKLILEDEEWKVRISKEDARIDEDIEEPIIEESIVDAFFDYFSSDEEDEETGEE